MDDRPLAAVQTMAWTLGAMIVGSALHPLMQAARRNNWCAAGIFACTCSFLGAVSAIAGQAHTLNRGFVHVSLAQHPCAVRVTAHIGMVAPHAG